MKILKRGIAVCVVLLSVIFGTTIAFGASNPFNQTIEGTSSYIVTGESYASNIQLAGYNAKEKQFYTNLTAETTKTVAASSVATFNYEIDIFDGSSNMMGNLGTYATPQTVAAAPGATNVQINNKVISLSLDLPASFREVVNIDSVTVAP